MRRVINNLGCLNLEESAGAVLAHFLAVDLAAVATLETVIPIHLQADQRQPTTLYSFPMASLIFSLMQLAMVLLYYCL